MSTTETIVLIVVAGFFVLILGNVAFQMLAERKNPPIGLFIECDGVRLHYIERGDPSGPCVVLFHGNGTMVQDLILSGLVDRLAPPLPRGLLRSARIWSQPASTHAHLDRHSASRPVREGF
jgi:hypothetical protein